MKRPGFAVVWPSNVDSGKTRGRGRKVPVSRAVKGPSLKELVAAANVLGFGAEPVEGAARPGLAWEKTGLVFLRKTGRRVETLRLLAQEVARARARAAQQPVAKPRR